MPLSDEMLQLITDYSNAAFAVGKIADCDTVDGCTEILDRLLAAKAGLIAAIEILARGSDTQQ